MEISINEIIQDVDNWTSYSSNRDSLVLLSDTKLLKCHLHYTSNSLVSALLKTQIINKMEKEVKIQVPEGYVIDKENSTFECIKFKKKPITFTDIADKYENEFGFPVKVLATSNNHMHKINALNKLMIVAKYLNNGWVPDFNDIEQEKSIIIISNNNNITISHSRALSNNYNLIYFKSAKLARQAIDILGEDTIRKALNIYY